MPPVALECPGPFSKLQLEANGNGSTEQADGVGRRADRQSEPTEPTDGTSRRGRRLGRQRRHFVCLRARVKNKTLGEAQSIRSLHVFLFVYLRAWLDF